MVLLILAPIFFMFLGLKYLTLGIRISDTGVYVLTAHALSHGQKLYSDIFFTNAPLYPQLMRIYLWFMRGDLRSVFGVAPYEAVSIVIMLTLIARKKGVHGVPLIMTPIVFLYSFMIFATTDHATGVLTSMIFVVGGWLCITYRRYVIAGLLLAVAIGVKAYVAPICVGLLVVTWFQNTRSATSMMLACAGMLVCIFAPTLIEAHRAFFEQLFGYSLTRPGSVHKWSMLQFAVTHDWILAVGVLIALYPKKPLRIETLAVLFQLVFLTIYADVYYYYLLTIAPFAVIALVHALHHISLSYRYWYYVAVAVVLCSSTLAVYRYYDGHYDAIQSIQDIDTLTERILYLKPRALYGDMDVVPALAYLTNIPVVANQIDTNATLFLAGRLDAKKLTYQAIAERAIIITHGAYYPQSSVNEPLLSFAVDKASIRKHCSIDSMHPALTESGANRIVIWTCR